MRMHIGSHTHLYVWMHAPSDTMHVSESKTLRSWHKMKMRLNVHALHTHVHTSLSHSTCLYAHIQAYIYTHQHAHAFNAGVHHCLQACLWHACLCACMRTLHPETKAARGCHVHDQPYAHVYWHSHTPACHMHPHSHTRMPRKCCMRTHGSQHTCDSVDPVHSYTQTSHT